MFIVLYMSIHCSIFVVQFPISNYSSNYKCYVYNTNNTLLYLCIHEKGLEWIRDFHFVLYSIIFTQTLVGMVKKKLMRYFIYENIIYFICIKES